MDKVVHNLRIVQHDGVKVRVRIDVPIPESLVEGIRKIGRKAAYNLIVASLSKKFTDKIRGKLASISKIHERHIMPQDVEDCVALTRKEMNL